MNKDRLEAILESHGVINVTFKNHPVWLERFSSDDDEDVLVKDLKTDEHLVVAISELKE